MSKFLFFFCLGRKKRVVFFFLRKTSFWWSSLILRVVFLAPAYYFNVRSPSAKKTCKKMTRKQKQKVTRNFPAGFSGCTYFLIRPDDPQLSRRYKT